MSTLTQYDRLEVTRTDLLAGGAGGVVGAAVMAALIVAMNEPTIAVAIPSLYTLAPPPSVPAGVGVHLFHGAVLGLVFAGVVRSLALEHVGTVLTAGVGWGIATWAGLAAIVMPLWLDLVNSPASPPLPNFAPPSLLWHVVYGIVLGGTYLALRT